MTIILHPDYSNIHNVPVSLIQNELKTNGYSPGLIDGDPGSKTRGAWNLYFEDRTASLLSQPICPEKIAISFALLDAAKGMRRGSASADALVIDGGGTSTKSAWCAYAAAGWLNRAAKSSDMRMKTRSSGGVLKWWHRLKVDERINVSAVRKDPSLLLTGLVFFRTRKLSTVAQALSGGTPVGHCGLVESWFEVGKIIKTIEGNTNDSDSAVGGRVVAKKNLDINDGRLLGFAKINFI